MHGWPGWQGNKISFGEANRGPLDGEVNKEAVVTCGLYYNTYDVVITSGGGVRCSTINNYDANLRLLRRNLLRH